MTVQLVKNDTYYDDIKLLQLKVSTFQTRVFKDFHWISDFYDNEIS